VTFTIFGPCRTKKTSSQIVHIGKFHKLLPSKPYLEWFALAMQQAPRIRRELAAQGAHLPLAGLVEVTAVFYRERLSGDACGFYQALGDFLQMPRLSPKRNGAGIIRDDAQIESWDGSRRAKDAESPRIEVTIRVMGVEQAELFEEDEDGAEN
jgi:hypothetical protein